jgi:hypothetical protein
MRSLIFAASLLLTAPALATEWVFCGDANDEASVGVLLGGVEFANISGITLVAKGKEWASSPTYGTGEPIAVSQTYIGDDQIIIDFADEEDSGTLAQLRVYMAEEGEDYVQGGVLRVAGQGAWVVACEGP